MQPERRDSALLWDMKLYAQQGLDLAEGKQRVELAEPATRLALERAIEIIGEAARNVSRAFQESHPEIPWRQIVALRNVLAHQYATIDLDTLWRIATERLPELLGQLELLVSGDRDDQG